MRGGSLMSFNAGEVQWGLHVSDPRLWGQENTFF
jgi:hypothetical protein